MIRAKELGGRAVVDVDAAEKLGRIDRIVLDPESRRVAGFVVSRGSSIFKNDQDIVIPASSVHAVGPDAVTVHRNAEEPIDGLEVLPRVSDIAGRKVVSESGRLLGTVDDVLIDEIDGRIVGYALEGRGAEHKLRDMVGGDRGGQDDPRGAFLRADANLKAGHDLIVAPDDAVSYDWDTMTPPVQAPLSGADVAAPAPAARWKSAVPLTNTISPQWIRSSAGLSPLDKDEER